jgi:predicted RNase H-like HicB family nuclease
MTALKYVVYQEGKYYVSQCLNVDVASFGKTIDEAVKNLTDAVDLYLRDDLPGNSRLFHDVGNALIGEIAVNA